MDKTFEGHRTKLISSHVPLMNFLCEREKKNNLNKNQQDNLNNPIKNIIGEKDHFWLRGEAPAGILKGRLSGNGGPSKEMGCPWPPPLRPEFPPRRGLLLPPPRLGFADLGPDPDGLSNWSSGGGALVVGTSQSSVGGVTQRFLFLSNTSMAGHLWRRGYPPWQAQYLLQDLPSGTLPLASSLHRAEIKIIVVLIGKKYYIILAFYLSWSKC